MRTHSSIAASLVALSVSQVAAAQATSTLDTIEIYPSMHTASVYAAISGDDNANASAWVEIQPAGGSGYARGHDLLPLSGKRFAGSLFYLAPATSYDVRVVLDDPDNGAPLTLDGVLTTRADAPPPPTGATYWVDAALGSDTNPGSESAPFATIQAAASLLTAGDEVRVRPGIYREAVQVLTGGSADSPIWFRATGPGVVLDGSDPTIAAGPGWTDEGGGVYSTPFSGASLYVASDDQRIYDYTALAELQAQTAGLAGGFFVDAAAGRLYLALPDGSDPSTHTIHVAVLNVAFLLDTVSGVVVDGFEMAYYGADSDGVAVDVRDSSNCWVRNNYAHHMNSGFRVRRSLSNENVIELNRFRDTSVYDWPWDAVKAHTPEASAISVTAGRGNVVRWNAVEGSFNGIYTCEWATTDESIARDTDVYENLLRRHGDDGLEPEGACVNVRFWENRITDVYNAISVSPIVVGPTWLVRNVVQGYKAQVLKVNNEPTGWVLVYHTTGIPLPGMDWMGATAIAPPLPFGPFISRNNIYQANYYVFEYMQPTTHAGVDFDYDGLWTADLEAAGRFVKWFDVRYANMAELQASGTIEPHGFQIEPAYQNEPNGDLTLAPGNGLLDVGAVIPGINSGQIVGAGPDVGAYERGGIVPGPDDGGVSFPDAGTGGSDGGGVGGNGSGAGGPGVGASEGSGEEDSGCGCRAAPAGAGGWAALLATMLGSAALGRRRRTARRAPGSTATIEPLPTGSCSQARGIGRERA